MATKPAGNPPIWAQNVSYPAGADPWSNQLTKVTAPTATGDGFTPETGIVAEYANAELNVLSQWANWLSFGSNAAGLDAHVIETDAAGTATIAAMLLGNTLSAVRPLTVDPNTPGAGASAIFRATNAAGSQSESTGNVAAAIGICTGAAAGVQGQNIGGGGAGVEGAGDGVGPGVQGTGGDSGDGGVFQGGATAGNGVVGNAIASFFGVVGNGASGSPGGGGVIGNAAMNDQAGVAGLQNSVGADPSIGSSSAVVGVALSATAVHGKSQTGYGVWAESDTTTPSRAALHLEPQDGDPSNILEGDVFYHSAEDQLKARINGTTMGIWATGHGYAYLYGENQAQVDVSVTTFTSVITQAFVGTYEPKENLAGMTATVCFEFGSDTAGTSFQWRLRDNTAGVDVIASRLEEVHHAGAVANDRYLTAKVQYTIPLAGARSFSLQIRSVDGFAISRIRRASIEFTGSHG